MEPNFSGLTYLLGELGTLAALLGMLGFALVAHQIWVGLSHGTQAEREAAFLQQFTGCHDYMASEIPLLAGEAAPPTGPRSSDGATRHEGAVCVNTSALRRKIRPEILAAVARIATHDNRSGGAA